MGRLPPSRCRKIPLSATSATTRTCSRHVSKTEAALRQQYEGVDEIILSIDGLQPEKGHETLYVVRELTQKRVWFAEPLISATADEVRRLIAKAKAWSEALGKKRGLVVVGSAGRVCDGDRGGISGDAASLLRQSFSA